MMEKPGRWLLFSLALVVLSSVLVYSKGISFGADLKGGTRLLYIIENKGDDGSVESASSFKDTVEKTINVVGKRVDVLGLKEITVVGQGVDEILVELPGLTQAEIDNIKETITTLGRLEFRIICDTTDGFDLEREHRKLTEFLDKPENKKKVEAWQQDEIKKPGDKNRGLAFWIDLLKEFNAVKTEGGPVKGLRWYVSGEHEKYLRGKDNLGNIANWTPEKRKENPQFLPMRIEEQLDAREGAKYAFRGEDLTNIHIAPDKSGGRGIGFSIIAGRRTDFADFTGRNVQRSLAIILNDEVDSAPTIHGELSDGGVIESGAVGGYSVVDAKQLITVLETGSLRVKPKLESETRLGASLGEDSIRLGIWSSILALAATVGFMLLYYRLAGLIAAVSLAVNASILVGVLTLYSATLTLPGIGGFILTLAMAVDANILIYERIREERDHARGVEQAVRLGFERAFVTIIDSNLTTLLTSLVLFWIGTGPIKGLGLTLSVGILTTLFASLVFTKAVFGWLLSKKAMPEVKMMRMFKETPNLRFIKLWKVTLGISVVTSVAGLIAFFASPESVFGIDFVGGATAHVRIAPAMDLASFRDIVNKTPNFEGKVEANQAISKESDGRDGKYSDFIVKGKLTREARKLINEDAKGERAEQVNSFRTGLRKVLGDKLRPDPVSDLTITPAAKTTDPSDAKFVLNFETPIDGKTLLTEIARAPYLTNAAVAGAESAQPSAQFTVTGKIAPNVKPEDLQKRVTVALSEFAKSQKSNLSDPFPEIATIQPRAAKALKNKAILALLGAFVLIILFVRFRFHEYRYGVGGVIGIIHDLIVTLGVVSIANVTGLVDVEIDMTIIAVFLTIAGYSINDTVVIFDRIRENLAKPDADRKTLDEIIDHSCNQTLSRTLLTATAAFLSSALMFVINRGHHNPLEGFGFTMMVGIITGTYSSIWIASLWVVAVERWQETRSGKKVAVPRVPALQKAI
ncbi:MAG: protein translocase subunit SecD [Planctomycetes bacterium]|nr:protein translocase subunit SecD [Planctomycetota bacterium]